MELIIIVIASVAAIAAVAAVSQRIAVAVPLSSAVAATTVTVHLWKVGVDFVYAVVIAVAVGLVVGYANVRIRSWLKDPVLSTAVSFVSRSWPGSRPRN